MNNQGGGYRGLIVYQKADTLVVGIHLRNNLGCMLLGDMSHK